MSTTNCSIKAKVLLQLEGSDEQHNVGTIEIPINISFNAPKPDIRPNVRAVGLEPFVDKDMVAALEYVTARGARP